MANFFDTVISVLKQDERFFSAEGELLRNAVYEAAMKMDSALLKLLYNNEVTRERFFTDIEGISVFDKVGFGWVINNRQFLPDSYTRYKNKIGLVNGNGDYISTSNDVELVFPYKDCVLEGGQTKEDQKRSEIFYNETLAPDEVDRLLYPKVFTNAKRFTKDGVTSINNFSDADNLIIKGNISFEQLAQELRDDFSAEHCISANDDKEAAARQIALNSLEDATNPYRAVFEVKKLDEGWDVLNLFDIVRLYETRQSSGKRISPATISEAQLSDGHSDDCRYELRNRP